jgi:tRNA-specific 2-thiouridylase
VAYHTIGQRKGLHIGGVKGGKGPAKAVTTTRGSWSARTSPATPSTSCRDTRILPCWPTSCVPAICPGLPARRPHTHWVYTAKTRYRQPDAACEIEHVDAGKCMIRFAEPQWAITPGQSVVVYESRVCLGGGVIE